jgi:Na+-driven multidrug efflux pump
VSVVRDSVDPRILSGLGTALPIMAAGAALHGMGAVVRGYAIATGRIWPLTALAASGGLLVLLGYAVSPTLAAVSVGFALAPLPLLAGWRLLVPRGTPRPGWRRSRSAPATSRC